MTTILLVYDQASSGCLTFTKCSSIYIFIGFNYIEKSLSIRRGNRVQKNRKGYYLNCVERVYPKWLMLSVHITTIRNFFFFLNNGFLWCDKNTKHSNFRSQILLHFASLLQILSSGGFQNKIYDYLISLSLFPRQDTLAKTSFIFPRGFPPLRLSFLSF